MREILKIGLAVIRDGKFLIVRNQNTQKFLMPGGQPEKNEDPIDTLKREIKEEINCNLELLRDNPIGEFIDHAANNPGYVVKMKVFLGEVRGQIEPSDEVVEYHWFDHLKDDKNILSDIIRNHILPKLTDLELL